MPLYPYPTTSGPAVNVQMAQVPLPASLSVGATDVTVTWPTGFADTNYNVNDPIIETGSANVGKMLANLKQGSRTTTGCTITLTNTSLAAITTGGTMYISAAE